jgi:hypothetical protein
VEHLIKYSNFENINEGVVEDIENIKRLIERTGNEIYVWSENDRIYVRLNRKHVFDVNNNMDGAQSTLTFVTGILVGIVNRR